MTDKQWLILAKAILNMANEDREDIMGIINAYTDFSEVEPEDVDEDIVAIAEKIKSVLDANRG